MNIGRLGVVRASF